MESELKMLSTVASAVFTLSACTALPDFTTKNGVAFFTENTGDFFTAAKAEYIEERVVDDLVVLGYEREVLAACLAMTVVHIIPTYSFDCEYQGQKSKCFGRQINNLVQVSRGDGCATSSSYYHELAHWFQECARAINDFKHEDILVWQTVEHFELAHPCKDGGK